MSSAYRRFRATCRSDTIQVSGEFACKWVGLKPIER